MITAIFLKIIGSLSIMKPKINQKITPTIEKKYIQKEIPLVSLVLIVLMACGTVTNHGKEGGY